MVKQKHSERPTMVWEFVNGEWEQDTRDCYSGNFFPCEASRIRTLEALAKRQEERDECPAICQRCAQRLGLEW